MKIVIKDRANRPNYVEKPVSKNVDEFFEFFGQSLAREWNKNKQNSELKLYMYLEEDNYKLKGVD